ncbi:suppressor of cytokine signaling 1a [Hippocampus zosterae]|uniref:suppressor of cytokine signaling 1a n=1 Tax=Hippocampus zosterae TaxID=109293 RepID=UPI00223CE963|nr:suppressor of cytokine signaling 1a [Hippocampus zosterae]
MVANSAVDSKHHSSGASSSESSESAQLQPRVLPKPKQRSASTPCKYLTHFPTFNCKEDCRIITDTAAQLQLSGFYWGPLGVEEAHRMLKDAPPGSYLIRDSRQKDVFFTLSYHANSGPVSVRIDYKRQQFSLSGNERTFPSLFALLEHYAKSPKRSLRVPYRKWEPTLQELCRRRIMELCGGGRQISELPLTNVAQGFLLEFPYKL